MFCPGIFLGLLEPNIFLGFRLLPTFDHPRHLKSGVPPLWGIIYIFLVASCRNQADDRVVYYPDRKSKRDFFNFLPETENHAFTVSLKIL